MNEDTISLIECNIIEVKANPYKKPDKILLKLVDSYLLKYCIVPSMINGKVSIEMEYFIVMNGEIIKATTCPIAIPVHLAHRGNWYPLKKKLRSGN